jgi:hypothetical protein
VDRERKDGREIILCAKYPEEPALDTAERVGAMNAMLARFGAQWRIPEERDV